MMLSLKVLAVAGVKGVRVGLNLVLLLVFHQHGTNERDQKHNLTIFSISLFTSTFKIPVFLVIGVR